MNLLSSLEKFGFSAEEELDITKDPKQEAAAKPKKAEPEVREPEETDYLVAKTVRCPVCDHKFRNLSVRGTKARRLEPDFDLRPRYANIDILKYDVTLCPNCGYAAMNRYFEPLTNAQIGRVKAALGGKFQPIDNQTQDTYSYDEAIDRYKLALVSAMAKYVKLSEKSYICLKISWLLREKINEMKDFTKEEIAAKKAAIDEMEGFYRQAYNGFMQVMAKETPPFCGINASTMTFIISNMAMHFGDYAVTSKYVYEMIASPSTSKKMKERYVDLKNQLIARRREEQEEDKA